MTITELKARAYELVCTINTLQTQYQRAVKPHDDELTKINQQIIEEQKKEAENKTNEGTEDDGKS